MSGDGETSLGYRSSFCITHKLSNSRKISFYLTKLNYQIRSREENAMQFARINDIVIHYQIIGAPADKPILVFSNSLGTDFRIWRDVIVRLAGDFAIVLYDKRGHGLSDI